MPLDSSAEVVLVVAKTPESRRSRCRGRKTRDAPGQRRQKKKVSKYTRYMYNDDPLRQPGPHTRSYTPKRWQKPHTRTHTLESDKGHTHTLLHSKTGGAGWISLRGWAPSGAHAVGSLAASVGGRERSHAWRRALARRPERHSSSEQSSAHCAVTSRATLAAGSRAARRSSAPPTSATAPSRRHRLTRAVAS